MPSYVHGDLLSAPEAIIAHGCNCKGVMGSGVALAIKERWPQAFKAYQYAHASGAMILGSVSWAERRDGAWVANVVTQNSYGRDPKIRYASYDAIDRGLRTLVEEARDRRILPPTDGKIAIPLIGAGLGNAVWGA